MLYLQLYILFLFLFGAAKCLVQLPQLIAHTNMDQDAVNILKDHFVEVLKYVNRRNQRFPSLLH